MFTQSEIYRGDSYQALQSTPDKSVDCILTDPLYDLGEIQKRFLQEHFLRISRGWIIVFSPPKNQWIIPANQYLFWVKPISTKNTSRRYSNFVEMIFVYGEGTWSKKRHWSQQTNVFTDLVDGESGHPWEKPESLIRRLILNHTKEGDIILDPFCGSGTIPICADNLGRVGIGYEISKEWADYSYNKLHKGP